MPMQRRALLALGLSAVAGRAAAGRMAHAATVQSPVQLALGSFAALPAETAALISVVQSSNRWEVGHAAENRLFTGGASQTFILAEALRQCETGQLSEDQPMAVDDRLRSLASPVLADLSGHMPLRSVLEAMITHGDDTAADIALAACGVDAVRALIAEAGLRQTVIPASTRRFFSYLAGAPYGTDLGWSGMEALRHGRHFGKERPPLNPRETMASTAREMVSWYEKAMAGTFFAQPETATEYRRILSMADAISEVVPSGVAAYATGGRMSWNNFHSLALAGQMVLDATPATFCFVINWSGGADGVPSMTDAYRQATTGVLAAVRTAFS